MKEKENPQKKESYKANRQKERERERKKYENKKKKIKRGGRRLLLLESSDGPR